MRTSRDSRLPRHHDFALITGATSGIGEAFARVMPPTTGLLLTGRNEQALAEAKDALSRDDRPVETLALDLTRKEDRGRLVEAAERREVDLFVNNAGAGGLGAVLDQSPEQQATTIELNVVAMAELARALLPGMLARSHARGSRAGLIIVSSSAATFPLPFFTTYTASKAFGLYYSEGLAEELRDEPIDVMALLPGPTRSGFGSRAGFTMGNLPFAPPPERVARLALRSLGRRRVLATGRLNGPAVNGLMLPHQAVTLGLGQLMRLIEMRNARRAERSG
jgi:hypothetical protein